MVEDLVNQEIKAALPAVTEGMGVEAAQKRGASGRKHPHRMISMRRSMRTFAVWKRRSGTV